MVVWLDATALRGMSRALALGHGARATAGARAQVDGRACAGRPLARPLTTNRAGRGGRAGASPWRGRSAAARASACHTAESRAPTASPACSSRGQGGAGRCPPPIPHCPLHRIRAMRSSGGRGRARWRTTNDPPRHRGNDGPAVGVVPGERVMPLWGPAPGGGRWAVD